MHSVLPKPLHLVAGLPTVAHVLRAGASIRPASTVLVVGQETRDLAARLSLPPTVQIVVQDPPLGTGDAVRHAMDALQDVAWVVVLYADHPLLTGEVVQRLLAGARTAGSRATVLTALLADPAGYGRIERDANGRPTRIVERNDDLPAHRRGPTEINSGMMVLDALWARQAFPRLRPSPITGEYYLPGLVELAIAGGVGASGAWPVATVQGDPSVALGINDRVELAAADAVARDRIRHRLLAAGVTLVGAETIFIDDGVAVGADTTIYPFTSLQAGTVIGARCRVGPHAVIANSRLDDDVTVHSSTIEDTTIATGAEVGPYAHLRAGTAIGPHAHVGNYAELKNARLAANVKVGHVSYLGDVSVGAGTNIGAGTITANYDGTRKHQTEIGQRAFIGSDTILRAPVRVGDDARTGAGSVVTRDIPDGATAVGVPARVVRTSDGESGNRPSRPRDPSTPRLVPPEDA